MRKKSLPSLQKQLRVWMIFGLAVWMLTASLFHWEIPKPDWLIWNRTSSMPRGFYILECRQPEKGDIVLFRPTEWEKRFSVARNYIPRPDARLIKRMAAVAGDTYGITSEGGGRLLVNGEDLGPVLLRDNMDRPLPQLSWDVTFVVPEGKFLPIADHERSFDGRYTGTVPLENIIGVLHPIPLLTSW